MKPAATYRSAAPVLLFVIATAAFFATTAFFAHRKLLWFDELFTVFIARQPDWRRFVGAMTNGGDTLPPGVHVLTRASIAVFGEHDLAIRLPAICGYWMMLVGVFAFVRHRCSSLAAWSAAIVPLTTNAYWYAFEARPYGLLAGFSAAAIVAWQRASGPHQRRWRLMLAVALMAAMLTHWHAVLLLGIIGAAEVARTFESGERRPGVAIIVVAAAALTAPVLYPFLQHGLRFRGVIGAPDAPTFFAEAYGLMLGGLAPFLLVLLGIAAATTVSARHRVVSVPLGELAIAAGFVALPCAGYLLAWTTGSQLLPRYDIACIIGAAILVGYAIDRAAAVSRIRAAACFAVLVSAVCTNLIIEKLWLADRSAIGRGTGEFRLLKAAGSTTSMDSIVVADGSAFIRLCYYAPPDLARRLVHIADSRSLGSRALVELAAYAPIRVEPLDEFLSTNRTFELFDVGFESAMLGSIARRGIQLSPAATIDPQMRYGQLYHIGLDAVPPSQTSTY